MSPANELDIEDDPDIEEDEDGLEPELDDDDNDIPEEDDIIDFDKNPNSVLDDITNAFSNDYGDPIVIDEFVIQEINVFGQVMSDQLPPANEHEGSFISTTMAIKEDGAVKFLDVNVLCSGVAWYIVLPGFPFDEVLMAAKEIENLQRNSTNEDSVIS